jgi:hypothetical protein
MYRINSGLYGERPLSEEFCGEFMQQVKIEGIVSTENFIGMKRYNFLTQAYLPSLGYSKVLTLSLLI